MNNADMAITPIVDKNGHCSIFHYNEKTKESTYSSGLTKREHLYFKILSENANNLTDGFKGNCYVCACQQALHLTNVALKELEK